MSRGSISNWVNPTAQKNDWKKREGGINPDIFKELSKKDRKEYAEAGLDRWGWADFSNQPWRGKDDRYGMWEKRAWEHGFGNVKTVEQLKELYKKGEAFDDKKLNSMQDVKKFDKTSKKSIDKAIEMGIKKKWDEFEKNFGGSREEEDDSTDPKVVDGAKDWNSQYMDVINKFLERMDSSRNAGPPKTDPYLSYNQGPWTPTGGW